MDMKKISCAIIVAAATATVVVAEEVSSGPAPGPTSASAMVTPALGLITRSMHVGVMQAVRGQFLRLGLGHPLILNDLGYVHLGLSIKAPSRHQYRQLGQASQPRPVASSRHLGSSGKHHPDTLAERPSHHLYLGYALIASRGLG
ncbi:hypothetical protein CKAN_01156600 [Cinnamomum micranthum f. kanehirae]|uniref:Uncharacterized protein n=1 Tax=Cinnamomum micranthum f. kanehirae TaxID=337451 RepID=A0A3S3N8Q8_9MAGN|nr:hypothetical protein CKAN_01156600 [Cinnamomum micranthum f. kanehirae]